ncbi:hypothetical protein Verru16b_01950 [Lacunisphaera limnophila]|uniref:Uncharacterized protein n=1 Tax=Lacunisphaera limnophila TaxID=1838286 RepID=A0A1D8AVH9_9BACT|nr:hypothetical protein [Lacunisphaera limnophila]AOS44881.1 hypothetical protein Verru16b_01950 [Lacunisphaera limnophila]
MKIPSVMARTGRYAAVLLLLSGLGTSAFAEELIATAISGRVGSGYQRTKLPDGSFKPEYYALANGGRIEGTGSDVTVDRIQYPEIAEVASRLLARQNYRYAQTADQATLMIVLHWGVTLTFNSGNYATSVGNAASAMANLKSLGGGPGTAPSADAAVVAAGEVFENEMMKLAMENRVRDQINLPNARLLGYLDDLNESNDIRRWAGGGDRYNDLIADVEESRYYIIVSAYAFEPLVKRQEKKLLWQTRVSVRAPGNRFDDSVAAMMKGASKYFGQDSGKLVRGEESKGVVELGDLKFLGEAKEPAPAVRPAAKDGGK